MHYPPDTGYNYIIFAERNPSLFLTNFVLIPLMLLLFHITLYHKICILVFDKRLYGEESGEKVT